jgi:hypothetical protein
VLKETLLLWGGRDIALRDGEKREEEGVEGGEMR